MLETIELVVRRFEVLVGDEDDFNPQARLHFVDFGAFFVEQVGCNFNRHLSMNRCAAFFHRLFLNHPQHMKRGRLDIANHTRAVAAWAGHVRAFIERRAQPLS